MSIPANPSSPLTPRLAESLPESQLPRSAVPGWTLSIVIHSGLLALLLVMPQPRGAGGGGDPEFHQVGLYAKVAREDTPDFSELDADDNPADLEFVPNPEQAETPPPLTAPADVLPQLPTRSLLGPQAGPLPTSSPRVNPADVKFRKSAAAGAPGIAPPGAGKVAFFGNQAEGNRFIYVIDSSGSMSDNNAIAVARAELMASLENLDATRQFQIIFYHEKPRPMLHPDGRQKLFVATDINKTLARQFIHSIQPDLGTHHLPALKLALGLEPDVIFFLTDAKEPVLSAGELNEIQRLNRGRAQIHAVEFGKGEPLGPESFLQKLARQNGGSYAYRDVMKFRRTRPVD